MSKQIETKKILVNNGQQLIAKAKKYKNSDGEWKLLERYFTTHSPESKKGKGWVYKNNLEGFKISNGEQVVDIFLEDWQEINNFMVDGWEEICRLFPELENSRISWKEHAGSRNEELFCNSYKRIRENDLHRYLVAENSWHLSQIVHQWVQENKTAIQQSPNSDFHFWVEIIDSQDGNMYLYVGKKNDNGGREIKIGIKKDKYLEKIEGYNYNTERNSFYDAGEALKINWDLMLITVGFGGEPLKFLGRKNSNQTISPIIKEKILRNLDKICLDPIGYLANAEIVNREDFEKDYYKGNPNWKEIEKKVHKVEIEGEEIDLLHDLDYEDRLEIKEALIKEIKQNPQDWKIEESIIYELTDTPDTFKILRHRSGKKHWNVGIIHLNRSYEKGKRDWAEIKALLVGSEVPVDNNQINGSEEEKKIILQYFLKYNIESVKINPNNLELVIKYKSGEKKTILANSHELFCLQNFIENKPNKSLSLTELQTNTNHSTPDPNNHKLAIGLIVGGVILVGIIIIYFLTHKKKKNR